MRNRLTALPTKTSVTAHISRRIDLVVAVGPAVVAVVVLVLVLVVVVVGVRTLCVAVAGKIRSQVESVFT